MSKSLCRSWSAVLALMLMLAAGCSGGSDSQPAQKSAERPADAETPPAAAGPPRTTGPTGTATVAGTVRFAGDAPKLPAVKMDADPGCAKKHSAPPTSEALVLGAGNTIGNVFVHVKSGLTGGYAPPAEPAILDQDGCRYVPHVLGLMVGQPLKILNSDGLLHNVHALPKTNKTFNMAMPASRTEAETTFDKEEFMFKIKCDVHPWMGAYVSVMSHPYFDATAKDGKFEIGGLPAGSYEIEAWHEKLGTRTMTANVTDGEASTIDFTFAKP